MSLVGVMEGRDFMRLVAGGTFLIGGHRGLYVGGHFLHGWGSGNGDGGVCVCAGGVRSGWVPPSRWYGLWSGAGWSKVWRELALFCRWAGGGL